MAKIEHISAIEVLDSRGNPTVRATVQVAGGFSGTATAPSGASTGKYEARELRDEDQKRFGGRGVLKAVANVNNQIHAALLAKDTANQGKIDATLVELDGTTNKSTMGANAMLAVSLACARAEADSQGLPLYLYLQQLVPKGEVRLPIPQLNIINGGRHASNKLAIQEFQILPAGAAHFAEALRMGSEVTAALRQLLLRDGFQVEVGDEGGFAPPIAQTDVAFTYLVHAIEAAGYIPGSDIWIGIDAAASEFYDSEQKTYTVDNAALAAGDLADHYRTWRERYPIISIEDPFDQDDWSSWQEFTKQHDQRLQIVGDDLFVTNDKRIQKGILEEAANAVLVKPNQAGTLSETLAAIETAKRANMNLVISHRSGDTEDTFIADLAVAVGAGQIKAGAPVRSERVAKYNRLLEIEAVGGIKLAHDLQRFYEGQSASVQIT